jgi:hypothetical protein
MDHSTLVVVALFHVIAALVATLINVTMAHRRQASAVTKDNQRLRVAIHAELKQLLELYQGNIKRLKRGDEFILSSKPLTLIFKGHVGRVNLLAETEIPSVVSAYLFNEHVEGLASATCKAQGTFAYLLVGGKTSIAALCKAYQRGKMQIEETINQLESHIVGPIPQDAMSWSTAETARWWRPRSLSLPDAISTAPIAASHRT